VALWVALVAAAAPTREASAQEVGASADGESPKRKRVFAIRPFLQYGKGSVSLRPGSRSGALWRPTGVRSEKGEEVPVWQPNLGPSLGLALELGDYLGIAGARAIEEWQPGVGRRGRSEVRHLEAHSQWKGLGLDAWRQDYRGMYLMHVGTNDARPLGDSLFSGGAAASVRPGLRLVATGASVLWIHDAAGFPIRSAMLHKERPKASGWSFLAQGRVEELSFGDESGEPLLDDPDDIAAFGPDLAGLTRLRATTASVAPGVGGVWLGASSATVAYYAAGAATWGLGAQDHRLSGATGARHNAPATTGTLRGALGAQFEVTYVAVNGFKGISTLSAPGIAATHTVSMVEVTVGARW
jgi:hypothetical protein